MQLREKYEQIRLSFQPALMADNFFKIKGETQAAY